MKAAQHAIRVCPQMQIVNRQCLSANVTIFTIGYGGLSIEDFVKRLADNQITAIADVRSRPGSARQPEFGAAPLKAMLAQHGISYVAMGSELGGIPRESGFYESSGHVNYAKLATSESFLMGVARLIRGAKKYQIALMCAEISPHVCHRHNLIAPILNQHGVEVVHILSDGTREVFGRGALFPPEPGRSPKAMRGEDDA